MTKPRRHFYKAGGYWWCCASRALRGSVAQATHGDTPEEAAARFSALERAGLR